MESGTYDLGAEDSRNACGQLCINGEQIRQNVKNVGAESRGFFFCRACHVICLSVTREDQTAAHRRTVQCRTECL